MTVILSGLGTDPVFMRVRYCFYADPDPVLLEGRNQFFKGVDPV